MDGFDSVVPRWTAGLTLTRNLVRQTLVERQLDHHLPLGAGALAVDVGCGQGTIALALAARGFRVVGIDPSAELLDLARTRADELRNLDARFELGSIDDLASVVKDPVDVICCHGVLMYLPDLDEAIGALVSRLKPGGLLSVLTRNRAAIAFRAGMTQQWREAVEGFDARYYDNRLGVANVRADTPEEVEAACEAAGASVERWYGVRLFTDHWGDVAPPEKIDDLIDAEEEAGRRDPYRRLASLTHVIAHRR